MSAAANRSSAFPYRYGGGLRPYDDVPIDSGYDGSGPTSYVLHAAGPLSDLLLTEQLREFGKPGPGEWATIPVCADGAHEHR